MSMDSCEPDLLLKQTAVSSVVWSASTLSTLMPPSSTCWRTYAKRPSFAAITSSARRQECVERRVKQTLDTPTPLAGAPNNLPLSLCSWLTSPVPDALSPTSSSVEMSSTS